ncbi:hypothetical protein ACP70R_038097 [Stipagrostis hirtigluma subsp. patula]
MAPLLLLPVLLLLAAADAFPASCTNVTCGGHAVRYPFWLNSSASDCCGYPGLGLACEDDNATLILPVQNHRYRVVGIDYATHTVIVSDADVDEHAAGCPRLRLNLTIDTTSSWLRLAPSDSNITFLYDCKKSISLPSSAVELSGCRDYDDGRRSYVLPDGGITGAEAHEYECDEVVVAPVLGVHKEGMVLAPGAPPPPLVNGSFGAVVKAGFELMYSAQTDQCGGCERSGGWCGYRRDETHGGVLGFTCFCDGGATSEHCGASYCGYPGFAVLCEDGKAAMEFGGEKYYVSNIDYNDFTVSLVDPEVQEDGSCPIADHNVTLPQTSWMYYPNTTVDYLVFFLNCSFGSGIGRPTNISPIGCDIFGGGLSFVLPRRDVPAGDWWRACQQVVEVPVLKYVLPADPQNDPDWRNRGFGRALRAGFQLAWERKNSSCDQCERSEGRCGYTQTGEFTGCLCSDRRVQAHNCTTNSAAMTFLPCLLLVGLHVHASHGAPLPLTYDRSMCSDSYYCGSVEIRYPFHLSNATGVADGYSTPYSCGYTDLNITCHAPGEGATWTPIIQLGQGSYRVLSIAYDTSSIILSDADAFGRGGSGTGCPRVRHNVTFGHEWLRYDADSRANLTFFFGCYAQSSVPAGLDAYRISCPDFVGSPGGGVSFVFAHNPEEDDETDDDDLERHCSEVFVAPVQSDSPLLRGNNRSALPREYGAVLRQGFELAWSPMATDGCHLCEQPGPAGGRCAYGRSREFLGCLCPDGIVGVQDCKSSSARVASASRHGKTITYVVASISCLLLLCLLTLAFFLTRKYGFLPFKSKNEPSIESFLQKNGNLHPKRYTYADVKRMTKSLAIKLGQGGFGAVYRGSLSDGRQVAVKMLKDTKGDGEEFMNEVASISRTSHVNVVTLLGFCLQGSKRALIYEYMPNGSLEKYAFNSTLKSEHTLTWDKLFDIAIGIARGLEYLHRGCNTRIVHFDIKPHNILLDQDFCPKISDFGLAKLCLSKESAISIAGARGTIGYIAPEVYSKQFGTVSSKSDVYSYGMMVLEMVGAREKNINANSESSSQYFPQWIYEHLDDYCISASEINGETTELVRKMIVVGLWCIQVIPTERPTMTRVVEMLEDNTSSLELPPKGLLS